MMEKCMNFGKLSFLRLLRVAILWGAAITLTPQLALAQESFSEADEQDFPPAVKESSSESDPPSEEIQVGPLTFFTSQANLVGRCPNLPVEDFENPLQGGVCLDASLSSAGGTCYAPGELIPGFTMTAAPPGGGVAVLSPPAFGVNSVVAGSNIFAADTYIALSPPVAGVGVDVETPIAPGQPITMNVFAPGNVFLGSANVVVPATPNSQFFGVSSTQPIAELRFTGLMGELFDNLSFGDCGIDHYLFYYFKKSKLRFNLFGGHTQNIKITLADQFTPEGKVAHFTVKAPYQLGNPADKNGEGIGNSDTHLMAYHILPNLLKNLAEGHHNLYKKLPKVRVTNQFGELRIKTLSFPTRLLVPSAKSLEGPVEAPDDPPVDHFQCYAIEDAEGFEFQRVSVVDQFEDPKNMTVMQPLSLCNTTDKNGEGITNPNQHLVCYQIVPDWFHDGRKVYTNNQFGPLEGEAQHEMELCVPSEMTMEEEEP